jgi:DegV family protein with EDD domain
MFILKGLFTMNFAIISDGACDLLPSYTQKHDVHVVPFYATFDGITYTKEGFELDHDSFYKRMIEEHAIPKSSLPSIGDYCEVFKPLAEAGQAAICICITAKFSGSYNSAMTARDTILEEYPDARITVIDSTLNTVCQGLYVNEAVRMRDAGLSYEEAISHLERIKDSGRIYFTVGSMEYLVQNGRVGKLAVLAGDKLGIKPLIIMKEGDICLGGVTRSRKKAKQNLLSLVSKYFEQNQLKKEDYAFVIGAGYGYEEAAQYKQEFESYLGVTCDPAVEARIGACIGCHTGPYALGIAFVKHYDA